MSTFDRWLVNVVKEFEGNTKIKTKLLMISDATCWSIWKQRCNAVFQKRQVDPNFVIDRSNDFVAELMALDVNMIANKKGYCTC